MAFNGMGEGRDVKLALFLSPDEVHRMFKKARKFSSRDFKILMLLYYFGLRNSEMTSLRKEHIYIADKTIKIVQGKGRKDRIIPVIDLNPFGSDEKGILDYLAEWKGSKDETGLIIIGDSADGSLSRRTVARRVKNYAKLANVNDADKVHPHTLRHSYATHLYNMGVPLDIVQALLGHSNIKTTQIYSHMGIDKLRKEVRKAVRTVRFRHGLEDKLTEIDRIPDKVDRILEYQKIISKGLRIILDA
jgi:integrase/recombinase XerC